MLSRQKILTIGVHTSHVGAIRLTFFSVSTSGNFEVAHLMILWFDQWQLEATIGWSFFFLLVGGYAETESLTSFLLF